METDPRDPAAPARAAVKPGPRVPELLAQGLSFSFEFFPPRDEAGTVALWETLRSLERLQPTFVSVTYGAGGSTRDRTIGITRKIAVETTMVPMAHLTCVGHTREEMTQVVRDLAGAGIRNVLALRGDPEAGPGTPWVTAPGGLTYASQLVALVRRLGDFSVGVAAFPLGHREAATLDDDVAVLLAKQSAGAEFAITEMFFQASDYASLVERAHAAGVTIPIVPGIMPITSLRQVTRMAELSGREVPASVVSRIAEQEGDAEAVRRAGIAVASELCESLLSDGAPGLHFYTLNKSKATSEIYANLRLPVG
ncbi:methylenetetrahydrofolate reductase [NAD(P)H] [Nocardioides marmoribigeumensis]|uniref:Methylenetetrahydrofolate reductase n=1 Tax=Nocardioides marmoribigeumensis TaxID=433649 RepID=A0ABU2BU65_9ACTN|nr:methylenetetrahydrofolate reductase [NAD(P)H] [Nocardioides marmoribigeumensis]MDR7361303.1 methylenetetrahydrofolate reductase (NADPH) [Nocardioides marmoribigeumensis]